MKKKFLISLFLFLALICPTQADNISEATAIYNEAVDLYKQDDVKQSIELFKSAIQLNPDFYEANYNLAQILMSQDKDEEALKALQKAVEIKPEDSESLYNIGKIQYKRGYLSNSHLYLSKIQKDAAQYESAKILLAKIEKRQDELNLEAKLKEHKSIVDTNGKAKGVEIVEIDAPSGVAVDENGNIYSASFGEDAIYKVSTYGKKTVLSKSNLIKGPIGVAVDKNNNVYVANYSANNLIKITQNGAVSVFADVQKPYCLIYDPSNNRLYVTEQNTNKIIKFDL